MSRNPGFHTPLPPVLVVLALFCPFLQAGVNTWTAIGPPGGPVTDLAVDPLNSGVVFATGASGNLHRTTDFGSHWTAVQYAFDGTRAVAIHPQNPSVVLVGDWELYRSSNGGGSWSPVSPGIYLGVRNIVFAPGDPNVVYAATTNRGVRKSTDAGLTWADFSSGLPPDTAITRVGVVGNGDRVYAGTDGRGVYLSTDGGGSWGEQTNGIANGSTSRITAVAVDPANGQTAYAGVRFGGLYKTTNGGASWFKPSTDEQVSSLISDLRVSPQGSQILYAAAGSSGVAKSTNGGVNWTSLNEGLLDLEIISIGVDPQSSQILYAGSKWSGAFLSTDGGLHWSAAKSGLNNHDVNAFVWDPSDRRFLYVATTIDRVYRTSDGGTSWEQANTGLPMQTILSLAWVPGSPASLLAGVYGRGVYRSTDRGTTWVPSNTGIETEEVSHLVVDPASGVGVVYAATTDGEVFRTIDAGINWTGASEGLPGGEIVSVAADPHQPGRVFAAIGYVGIFRSLNGGGDWSRVAADNPELSGSEKLVLDAVKKNCLYLRTGSRVFRSTDAGVSWVPASTGLSETTGQAFAADPSRSGSLYTSEFYGIYRSVNGGGQWTDFNQGTVESLGAVDLYSDGADSPTIYASTSSRSMYAITLDYSNVFYFPQVGDGTLDDVSLKTSLVLVNTGERNDLRIDLFDSKAQEMPLSLGSQGTAPAFAISLGPGEAVSFQTPGTGAPKSGYARISTGPSVGGTAVFTYAEQGVIQYESGVPGVKPLTDFSLFMDSSGNSRETGVALVNTGPAAAAATVRLYDTSFQPVSNLTAAGFLREPFGSGHHFAAYAPEIFPEVNSPGLERGVMTVHSDQPVAAVTLRQHDNPALGFPRDVVTMSTFPVVAGRADAVASPATAAVLYFPQVADGQQGTTRFRTTVVLVNARAAASSAQIEFFSSDASRMTLQLGTLGTAHTFTIPLASGQAVALQTAGTGAFQAGYAKLTTDSGVGGTVVFTYEQDGVTLYDAGVPASSPQREMTFFMDASGTNYETGFALVNTGAGPAQVTLRLYDTSFNLIETLDLKSVLGGTDLGPGQQLARYASEIFALINAQNLEHGVVTIESSQPLATVTLRQQDQPGVGLPGDVYLVTAFPVVPGRAQ